MGNSDDLVLLAADKQMEEALRGILSRPRALNIRPVTSEILRHPGHDSGCRLEAHHFLRPFHNQYHHALVLFDYDGCGASHHSDPEEIEQEVEENLRQSGWQARARCVVIDPELEVWIWSDSPEVGQCLGWGNASQRVQDWLEMNGLWPDGDAKPNNPKKAVESALKQVGQPRSSALFRDLASSVSLQRCKDSSFQRFRNILRQWFPPTWREANA